MTSEQAELKGRLQWLIKLRWVGCVAVFIAVHLIREAFRLNFPMLPVYIILGSVIICNLYFQSRLKFITGTLINDAILQISLDYIALAAAIYFSGGCDSPFLYYYIFHIVITGVILPPKWTFRFTALAVALPAVVFGLKHIGILPHFSIFGDRPVYFTDIKVISVYGAVFVSTLILTAYFVTYLSAKLLKKHEEIKRLYLSQCNFIANLAHEIKSPLNAIGGFMSLLSDKSLELPAQEREKYQRRVENACSYINSLLNDIMQLSRIEAGIVRLSISPFKIADLINDSTDMFSLKAREKGIAISVEIEDIKEQFCCGDARRVREIVVNLLDNAVKYTPASEKVGIKARNIGDSVEITVWDTGKGIAPGDRERIFDAYERLRADSAQKIEGAGLGLSIVRKLVELHGSTIRIESEMDKGSSFIFTLPVKRKPDRETRG
jgi:signal transduction histidine kinase